MFAAIDATVATDAEIGFATANRLLLRVSPGEQGYDQARGRQMLDELLTRATALPGVLSATTVLDVPLGTSSTSMEVRARDQSPETPPRRMSYNVVGPGYFETLEIPVVRGRSFDAHGAPAQDVAIVNEMLAGIYWPDQDPIGRELVVAREGADARIYQIIGVASDAKYNSVREARRGYIYLPFARHYRSEMTLVLHTAANPAAMTDAVAAMVRDVDPALPSDAVTTLEASVERNALGSMKVGAGLLAIFGALGTALAVFGMFGLLSYTTQLQKREIGVRRALGAGNARVMRLLLGRSLRLAGRGIGAGLAVSLLVTMLLRSSIFGIGSVDLATFVIVPALLAAVTLIAGYVPVRRLLVQNPMQALGHE